MLNKLILLLPLMGLAASAPLSARQSPSSNDDDDGLIYSPSNGTSVTRGSTFNFTYLCDDDDTTKVDVALIRYIRIGGDLAATGNDRKTVNVDVSLPTNIAPGRYLFAVDERENDNDSDKDGNDDDDNDDDNDNDNGDDNGDDNDNDNDNDNGDDNDNDDDSDNDDDMRKRDDNDNDNDSAEYDFSEYDLITARNNNIKSPYWIVVSNSSSMSRRDKLEDDDDNDVFTSPKNGTVLAPGASFRFTYQCEDDCDSVRLALVRYYRVLQGTQTTTRGNDRYVSAQVTVPARVPAGNYILGVNERDGRNGNGETDNDDNDDDSDTDNVRSLADYFDYDISFNAPQADDENRFVISVR